DDYAAIFGPDDAIVAVHEMCIALGNVAAIVARARATDRVPRSDVVPVEGGACDRHGIGTLEKSFVDRQVRGLLEELFDSAFVKEGEQRCELRGIPVQFLEERGGAPHEDPRIPEVIATVNVLERGVAVGLLDEILDLVR